MRPYLLKLEGPKDPSPPSSPQILRDGSIAEFYQIDKKVLFRRGRKNRPLCPRLAYLLLPAIVKTFPPFSHDRVARLLHEDSQDVAQR